MNKQFAAIAPLLLALGSAPLAVAQTGSVPPAHRNATGTAATLGTRPDAKPIEDLLRAAQRMRDAIHGMLNEPAGAKRTEMIRAGDRALAEIEDAMVNLPPALLTAEASESSYKKTVERLQRTAGSLHAAAQALARDPNSKRRNQTIKKIKTAVEEAHRLMHEIPRGTSAT